MHVYSTKTAFIQKQLEKQTNLKLSTTIVNCLHCFIRVWSRWFFITSRTGVACALLGSSVAVVRKCHPDLLWEPLQGLIVFAAVQGIGHTAPEESLGDDVTSNAVPGSPHPVDDVVAGGLPQVACSSGGLGSAIHVTQLSCTRSCTIRIRNSRQIFRWMSKRNYGATIVIPLHNSKKMITHTHTPPPPPPPPPHHTATHAHMHAYTHTYTHSLR